MKKIKLAPKKENKAEVVKEDCFIIMPISDPDGYEKGHFKHVYENIIRPSCEMAGYNAVRGDDVKAANLIHLDILKRLIDAPLAICDLSARNPNVLFELGIRQAFDKPVVLIQEEGTPKIFDIAPLRCMDYSKDMKYHNVLNFQQTLKETIIATAKANDDPSDINSIVKLLALNGPATLPDLGNGKDLMEYDVLRAEIRELKHLIGGSDILEQKLIPHPIGISFNDMPWENLQHKIFSLRSGELNLVESLELLAICKAKLEEMLQSDANFSNLPTFIELKKSIKAIESYLESKY